MGEALLSGMLDAGWDTDALSVAEVEPERRRLIEERFRGVRVVPSPAWAVAESDVVVLAVKPSDVGAALEQALPSLKTDALVLSLAAAAPQRAGPGAEGRRRDRRRSPRHRGASRRGGAHPRLGRCRRARPRGA